MHSFKKFLLAIALIDCGLDMSPPAYWRDLVGVAFHRVICVLRLYFVLLYLCFQMWVLGGVGIAVLLLLHFASSQKLGAGTGSGSCRAFPYRAENVSNLFWFSPSFLWIFDKEKVIFEVAYVCILLLCIFEEQRAFFYQVDFFIR